MILIFTLFLSALAFRPFPENKYLLLSTSKFWYNVRQSINTLLIYQQLKKFGVRDENIALMISEDSACNRRNNIPGFICPFDEQTEPNLFKHVQLDYKKNDVNIKNWIDVFRGKYDRHTPQARRIQLSRDSRFMSFLNGHGGDGYTKMQDTQYLLDFEMAKITKELEHLQRYKEGFLISDSCGAITLYETVEAKNLILLGSSSRGEKSYSKGKDSKLLVAKTDRFSYTTHEFLSSRLDRDVTLTLEDQFKIYDPKEQDCTPKLMITIPGKSAKDIKVADFWKQKPRKYEQVVKRRKEDTSRAKQQFLEMVL